MNNNYTFDGLRRVCKQKTEMYTTWQIGWLPVQGTWLGLVSQSVTRGSMWPTGQTSNNYPTNSNNKVSFVVAQVWPCHIQIVD